MNTWHDLGAVEIFKHLNTYLDGQIGLGFLRELL